MTKHSTSPSDVNMEFSPLLSVHSFKQKAVNTYYVRLASFLPPGASNLERRRKATECRAGQSTGGKSIPLSVVMSTAWVARLKVEPSPLGGAAAGGVGGAGFGAGKSYFHRLSSPFLIHSSSHLITNAPGSHLVSLCPGTNSDPQGTAFSAALGP